MLSLINWRLKITINDGRAFIGQMLAFDRHMNLVLADCEEFRRVRPKKKPGETEASPEQDLKRALGLVILRGETVVSLSVEGPPPVQDDDKKNAVRDTALGAGLGYLYGALEKDRSKVNDVKLKAGTEMGVRLDRDLKYARAN